MLTADDLAALSPAQLDALNMATPIVLDFGGHGVSTVAAAQGTQFDLNAAGGHSQRGWVGADTGLLALDRNGDGLVNDGSELFGSGTTLANGQRAANGYAALAELDANHDGHLNAHDAAFAQLKVWMDRDGDGQTDAGELLGLAGLGVVDLGLTASTSTAMDHGNLIGLVSSYTTADGQQHQMADVWFSKGEPAAAPVQLSDLLAAPATELLGGSGTAHPVPEATAAVAATVADDSPTHTAAVLPLQHGTLDELAAQRWTLV